MPTDFGATHPGGGFKERLQSDFVPETLGEPRGRRSFQNKNSKLDPHRAVPASLDAEKGLLCSILLAPDRWVDECIQQGVSEEYFHWPAHQVIYSVARDMQDAGRPIDLISITQYLSDKGRLDEVGGAAALSEIFTFVPTATNAGYYLEILREKYLLRKILTVCSEFAARAYEEQDEVKDLLDEVEARILSIGDERFRSNVPDIQRLTMEALDRIEKIFHRRGEITGLASGFSELDRLLDGLHGGEMIVIAARPSMGKTALAMNIAEHVCVEQRVPVVIYSLEMSSQQLMQRLLCSRAKVDLNKVRQQMIGPHDMKHLIQATQDISSSKLYIDDTPGLSILELRAHARRMHKRFGVGLIVIDYLQLLRSPSKRGQENRQIEVAEISAGVKALAKELNIPIIVLAQLNRNPEIRSGGSKGKPRLSDLRESGSIEQDADVVALLYREDYYASDEEEKKETEGIAELIVAKQRNGPTGEVPLTFLRQFTRFESRALEKK